MKTFKAECFEPENGRAPRRIVEFTLAKELSIIALIVVEMSSGKRENVLSVMPDASKEDWLQNLQNTVVYGDAPKGTWLEFSKLSPEFTDGDQKRIKEIKLVLDKRSVVEGL